MANFFTDEETACQCGCGENNIALEAITRLDHARKLAGIPFVIDGTGGKGSACRCVIHNKNVGGSNTSSHISDEVLGIECKAFDIGYDTSHERFLIIDALIKAGFTRIGIAKNFIHCDTDHGKAVQVMWLYS